MVAAQSALILWAVQAAPAVAQQPGAGGPPRGFGASGVPLDFDDHTGFVQIFDGETMAGWDGAPEVWRVEEGALVAVSTPENPVGTTFIIWRGGEVSDFHLKLEVQIEGSGNGGIQYRSRNAEPDPNFRPGRGRGQRPGRQGQNPGGESNRGQRGPGAGAYTAWNLQGYQADFNVDGSFAGQLFEGGRFVGERGITTSPGQVVILTEDASDQLIGTIATPEEVRASFKPNAWNQYEIIARGYTFFHLVGGKLISVTVDGDPSKRVESGLIGLQIEGRDTKVSYRNIWLKAIK